MAAATDSDAEISVTIPQHHEGFDQHEQILPSYQPSPPNIALERGSGKARPVSFLHRPCLIFAAGLKWLPVVFITSVIGWSYYAFVVQLSILTVESFAEKALILVLYHVVLVLFASSYWQTVFATAGVTPSTWKLSAAMLERLNSAKNEEDWKSFLDLFVVEMQLRVNQRSVQGAIRYCDKCTAVKPDRSHHCSVCGTCVLKMDHHCPWVNNCVAFHNYKFFVLFLGYALVYCVFVACCTFKYFMLFWTDGLKTEGAGKFHILFLFFVSIMFCISVSSLFWYHVYLILHNRSTLEQFRAPYFSGTGVDADGWSLGRANNFREVFGYKKLLWFLPVQTTVGDGMTFPTRLHYEVRTYQSTSDIRSSSALPQPAGEDHHFAVVDMPSAPGMAGSNNHTAYDSRSASRPINQVPTQLVVESNNKVMTKVGTPRGLSYQ